MKKKWWFLSVLGLSLCGFGLSLLGEAIIFKSLDDFSWFYWGTASLVVFNTGLCIVAEATLLLGEIRKKKNKYLE
tara:strand:+ start:632 stop:856 length:225 start_codon:yes stop_codon:yes gene_type:complete